MEGFKEWNPSQTLEGLADIGLIVKYDQIDGLPEPMRPTVLQMLSDRARDLLRHAEVPVLQPTDETDMVGKPRLVFTITVNAHTAPAIDIESKLYQRVRLWRDPGKEMELATWRWRRENRKATHQLLFSTFGQVVNQFVRDYRAMNPKIKQAETRADPPAQLKDNANALEGLNGIDAYISLRKLIYKGRSNELLISDEHHQALSNLLPREAEKKLKQAGIPLLRNNKDIERLGWPQLRITITLGPPNYYAPAIEVRTEFWQQARTVRHSRRIYTATWESRASEGGPTTDEAVLRIMNSQLDEFINAYNAANPKVSSISN